MSATNPGTKVYSPIPPATAERPIGVPTEPLFYQDSIKSAVEYQYDLIDGQKVRSTIIVTSLVQGRIWSQEKHRDSS